jgi:isocitrate lyase
VWFETGEPSLEEATAFAKAIHEKFPGKLLAYNCSPSFNWKKKLDDETIAKFQQTLGALGYKFQVGVRNGRTRTGIAWCLKIPPDNCCLVRGYFELSCTVQVA